MSNILDEIVSSEFTNKDNSDYRETIAMAVTESKSFDSVEGDETEIRISLSTSGDSLEYDESCGDFKVAFESDDNSVKNNQHNILDQANNVREMHCDSSINSSKTTGSNQVPSNSEATSMHEYHRQKEGPPQHHAYHMSPYAGPPGTHPHFHPHYQHPYYPHGGPQYLPAGNHQQIDPRFPIGPQGPYHQGMPYRQSLYPPPHPNYHHPAFRQRPPSSSAMSVSSQGSRKRTIDGILEDDDKSTSFTKHRSSSNNSTCSSITAGHNTSSEALNKLICNSPMKKERTLSPESRESSLNFSGLHMGNKLNNEKSDKTPLSKNTLKVEEVLTKDFSFEDDNSEDNRFVPEEHSLKKQLREQSFTPIHHSDLKQVASSSPTFNEQLEIAPQLSWSIAGDNDEPELGDLNDWGKNGENSSSPIMFTKGTLSPILFESTDNQDDSPTSREQNGDIMKQGLLSPTGVSDNDRSPPSLSFPFRSSSDENMKVSGDANPYYKMQGPYSMLSPEKFPMPFGSPQPYHHHVNTPHSSQSRRHMHSMERRDDSIPRHMHPNGRDSPPNYQSPRGMYLVNGQDRIRNLRGRGLPSTLPPTLHLPPHFPSHAHFLTSPIGTTPRGGYMIASPAPVPPHQGYTLSPHVSASKRKCVPLKVPLPNKFQGDIEKMKNVTVPEFTSLVNFPAHMSSKSTQTVPDGMRCCVMCGNACPCSVSNKNKTKNKKAAGDDGDQPSSGRNIGGGNYAIIPSQNKGLCTQCDVNVWVVTSNNLQIKWCKGCKNFRPWAAFGEKGLATKCLRCRDRQREKYAAQKEEKDKKKLSTKKSKEPKELLNTN